MSPRTFAPIAAVVGFLFGGFGLVAAASLTALFGITLDAPGLVVVRLACAAYLGFGVLNALALRTDDASAWRAIAAGNGVGWGVGAAVMVLAIVGRLGDLGVTVSDARVWLVPAMQIAFACLWMLAFASARGRALTPSLAHRA